MVVIGCVFACKHFTGGEIKHHPDCPLYPDSMSERLDKAEESRDSIVSANIRLVGERDRLKAERNRLIVAAENLLPLITTEASEYPNVLFEFVHELKTAIKNIKTQQ